MKRNGGFAISMVYPMMRTIRHKGMDFEAFCRQVSFDRRLLEDAEARIDDAEMARLMEEAALYTQDEYFGLHQGQLTDIADMGILGYVLTHSGKIADALSAFQRYNIILCCGYQLDWEERGDRMRLRFFKADGAPMSRQCLEDMVSSVYHLIVRLSNRPIPVRELQFSHPAPADTGPYLAVFGAEPRFGGDETYLCLDKEVWQFPILYANPRLRITFETIAEETRNKLIRGKVFSDRIFQWLMVAMPTHFPTLHETAASFGMSARALQLKLKEENTSYSELSAAVRKELALSYLNKREYSIGEIAYLLHFSEPGAFHNAFKKWTGMTPGQYRAQIMQKTG